MFHKKPVEIIFVIYLDKCVSDVNTLKSWDGYEYGNNLINCCQMFVTLSAPLYC